MGASRYLDGRPVFDRRHGAATSAAGDGLEGVYLAILQAAPSGGTVDVLIPALSTMHPFTVRSAPDYAGVAGDEVAVTFDSDKVGWVISPSDVAGVKTFNGRSGAVTGVDSFNGRSGAVTPQSGDYNAAMVGALAEANNLSDVASAATARANLGVGAFLAEAFGNTGIKIAYGSTVFTGPVGPAVSYGVTFTAVPLIVISNGDGDANGCWVGIGGSFHPATTTQFYPESSSTSACRANWFAIGH